LFVLVAFSPIKSSHAADLLPLRQAEGEVTSMHSLYTRCLSFLILNYRENLSHKLCNTTLSLFVCVCVLMVHSGLIYSLKMQACEDKLFSRHSGPAGPVNSATGCETSDRHTTALKHSPHTTGEAIAFMQQNACSPHII